AVAFVDRSQGVLGAGYSSARHPGGAIELSSDGGRTWHVVRRTPRPVVALAPYLGFVYAQLKDGEILQSHDHGHTWRPASFPTWPLASSCPLGFFIGTNAGDPSWSLCTTLAGGGFEGKTVYRQLDRGWVRVACANFMDAQGPCG